jgi:hypothetical protein
MHRRLNAFGANLIKDCFCKIQSRLHIGIFYSGYNLSFLYGIAFFNPEILQLPLPWMPPLLFGPPPTYPVALNTACA